MIAMRRSQTDKRGGETVKDAALCFVAVEEVGADDVRRGEVDQVPVVHPTRILEIELVDAPSHRFVPALVAPDQTHERNEALLVHGALEQLHNIADLESVVEAARDRPCRRDSHPEEDVPLAVAAGFGPEVPLQGLHAFRLGGLP
jgi:hypothetical protein